MVVVSAAMARTFWPGERALGKCIIVGKRDGVCRTVVGVVADAHYLGIFERPAVQFYMTFAQADTAGVAASIYPGAILIRTEPGRAATATAEAREVLTSMAGSLGTPQVQTMSDVLAPILHPWRLAADLFGGAALLGLLVAATGVYGTIAYTVSLQEHEIGVRLALGAQRAGIVRRIVGSGLRVVGIGVLAGMALVFALGSLIASMFLRNDCA